MHTNVILANKKKRVHAQSNYTNTKLKAWFKRLLRHPARKRSGSILHRYTPGPTRGVKTIRSLQEIMKSSVVLQMRRTVLQFEAAA